MAAHLECDPSGRRRAEDLKKTSVTVSMIPGMRCDKLRIGVPYISPCEMYGRRILYASTGVIQ